MSDKTNERVTAAKPTIDGLALRQVVVVLACEQRIAVAAHNALDVAVASVRRDRSRAARAVHTRT
jgi:hypothetical protein